MTDWHSYVAGFFDGEGSVTIARQRVNGLSDYHCIHVTISQRAKHRAILDRIRDEFGGTIDIAHQRTRLAKQWAEQACWKLQDKPNIRRFLEAMQPHCIVKAPQIHIGLEFLQEFQAAPHIRDSLGRIRGKRLTADEIERRERLRLKMREANLCGPPRVKPSTLPPLDVQLRRQLEADMVANPATVSRGVLRYNARLTDDDVRAIRAEFAAGGTTKAALARKYSVTDMVVGGIIRRTRWKHVADLPSDTPAIDQLGLFGPDA